ncbi:MAG: hypothetical protein OFPI_01900 [Osedax symbiont Rs2]|nr:MAG: hypothetical protein OFPI_01900 [Osedax symbiont Rs2]
MLKGLAILLVISISACTTVKQQPLQSYQNEDISIALAASYQSWLKLKQRHGANYSYERDSTSSAGSNSTLLRIEDDIVEYRYFFQWQEGSTPSLSWSEAFAELNLHDQGSAVKNLDQLYRQCETQIFNKPLAEYALTFKVDQFNILKQCSSRQINCSEKCTQGIRIDGLMMN